MLQPTRFAAGEPGTRTDALWAKRKEGKVVMNHEKLNLRHVQETLLLPLWGRAKETKKKKPLLVDPNALSIINTVNYDFTTIKKNIHPLSRAAWIARSIYFDKKIKAFLEKNSSGTIINLGCGLDTTYDRVDNGKAFWYELDLPDVIELRREYIKETKRRVFISDSVLSKTWYQKINQKKSVLLLMAGVIYYFRENEVKDLFNEISKHFLSCEIIFDYCSVNGVKIANKKVIEKGGMSEGSYLQWGIDNIYDIEKWDSCIRVIENCGMFAEHKRKYPFLRRFGMYISDRLKVMSLAHIEISQ